MNRLHIQERYQNAEEVHRFYLQVLQSFVIRLEKQYRYKSQVKPEHIEDIQKIVREKISYSNKDQLNNKQHFEEYLGMKEASQKDILLKCEVEPESNFSKDKATISEYCHQQPNPTEKTKQEKQQEQEQDSFDDLQLIEKEINQKDKCWKEQPIKVQQTKVQERDLKVAPILKKEHENQDPILKYSTPEPPADSSEEQSQENFMEIVNQKIGTALVGTFTPLQVKRKPKQEKIFIELQNVFVKFINCPFENYFFQVNCELTKVEKENIKLGDK